MAVCVPCFALIAAKPYTRLSRPFNQPSPKLFMPKKETWALILQRMHEICEGIARSLGCAADVEIDSVFAAVDNDPQVADRVATIAAARVGAENIRRDVRTMISEDMSALMADVPGCFFFVGCANAERDLAFPHHNPRFDFDEDSLVIGASLLAEVAASFLIPDPSPSSSRH